MKKYIPIKNKEIIVNEIKTDKNKLCIQNRLITNHGNMDFNDTATYIYTLIDGNTDIDSIVKAYSKKYSSISLSEAKKDVMGYLKILWQTGVIFWKDNVKPFLEEFKINDYKIKFYDIKETKIFLDDKDNEENFEFIYAYDFNKNTILDSVKLSLGLLNNNLLICSIMEKDILIAKLIVMVKATEMEFSIRYLKMYKIENAKSFLMNNIGNLLNMFKEILIDRGIYIPRSYKYLILMVVTHKDDEVNNLFEKIFEEKNVLKNETAEGDSISYYKKISIT